MFAGYNHDCHIILPAWLLELGLKNKIKMDELINIYHETPWCKGIIFRDNIVEECLMSAFEDDSYEDVIINDGYEDGFTNVVKEKEVFLS